MSDKYNSEYVKSIRLLVEGEVEEAEVIMAARGFSKELQDMIQKIGRLANEQVGPVVDQIRLTYGSDMAVAFQDIVKGEMDGVLTTLATAKDSLDDVVSDISNGQVPGVATDMDGFEGGEMGGDEFGDEGLGDEADLGDLEADPVGDEFGGDELGDDEFTDEFGAEEPLGRNALESKMHDTKKKIVEMRRRLANERAKISEVKK